MLKLFSSLLICVTPLSFIL